MTRTRLMLVIAASLSLVLGACTQAAAKPGWTYGPLAGDPAGAAGTPAASQGDSGAVLGTIEVTAADLSFSPNMVTVATAGRYDVKLTNTGAIQHNLTFSDGTAIVADPGQTSSAVVDIPAGGLTFSCTIPGHAQAGMTGMVSVGSMPMDSGMAMGSPAPSAGTGTGTSGNGLGLPAADPNAPPYVLRDATAPAVMPGTVHDIDLPIIEKDMTVAAGYVVHVWTFGGTVPGPVIRVHLGDTVHVHLTNEGTMSHSIDFHASQTAMNDQMVEIKPGATFTYTFRADYAGVWMYHCGTAPALEHIANGMFGMVIVEPKGGLPKVDKELAFVQNEWYLGGQGQIADYTKASAGAPSPDFVTFNGVANQYKDNPISVPTKGRIRVFILDAGPSIDSSFHVVGTIFDTVIKEGIALLPGNSGGWGAQAVDLSPAQGAIIEFSPQEDGMYPFVTHAFNFTVRGAMGIFQAGDGNPKN
ncbi:MAG TPA: multicopper oxidase domain-containing protein [Candidatus Limnocylindrales bacterium]|nr:multicopper oxidase domain-containing protein [Candidatus Limnocylindrales bacterium]